MKKIVSYILVLTFIFISFSSVAVCNAAMPPEADLPMYNNALSASMSFSISNSGLGTVTITLKGSSSFTSASVFTKIQRWNASSMVWEDYNVSWTDNFTASGTKTHTRQFLTSGKYRAVSTFTVYGTLATDSFSITKIALY